MLFKVNSKLATDEVDFFELNPGALAIAEYAACTSRQMFFVCLVADKDYDSPLRTLGGRERRFRATQVAGWGMEGNRPDKNARNLIAGKVAVVEKAIETYLKDQYDEERAERDAVDAQIKEALAMMSRDKQEACKVIKTKTNGKTGEVTTLEYVDQVMASKLAVEAIKIGKELKGLKEMKLKLSDGIRPGNPLSDVITHTAADLDTEGVDFSEDETMSDLDVYMEKKRQINEQD